MDTVKPLAHTEPRRYSFEVVPVGLTPGNEPRTWEYPLGGLRFDPMIMEVPTLGTVDQAARRAYWQAFHLLGAQGVDVEEFEVFEFEGETRGRKVGPGGFIAGPVDDGKARLPDSFYDFEGA